jgi:hypothetical protein
MGYSNEAGCNLCAIWMPSPRSDERLLSKETFAEFAFAASLYRDREQGEALVREWARRRGGDPDVLLHRARLKRLTAPEREKHGETDWD